MEKGLGDDILWCSMAARKCPMPAVSSRQLEGAWGHAKIEALRKALENIHGLATIHGMAGDPDAAEGCRLIIRESYRVLEILRR
jgi:hypothetical protein